MARAGRHRRGGRTTPKGTRPLGDRRTSLSVVRDEPDEPDLLVAIRAALSSDEPLDLLAEVSSLISALDPRSRNPVEPAQSSAEERSLAAFVEMFGDVDQRETTALLAAIAQLGTDPRARRQAAAAEARRFHALPEWLSRLDESVAYRAVEMVHVLGDGDDVMIGVRLPGGHELTVVVYIDHNMGTIAKDAFVVSQSIAALVDLMKMHHEAPDGTEWRDISLPDARARAEEAVNDGARVFPPLEGETWPMCRPLVEWAIRLLPEGGTGYRRPEWSDRDRAELTEAFFASPFAAEVRGESYRDLFESLLWFGCDYGPGDPLRWSPVSVEILLSNWIPRKVTAGVGFLSKAPDLLRAFIRYAHDRQGISPALTATTLAAVDDWAPEYQRLIRTPRPQGPEALLVAMGAMDPDEPWDDGADVWGDWEEPLDSKEIMLASLRRAVGGEKALEALDTVALPDEEFVWDGVADDVRGVVGEVLAWCDRFCDDRLDAEYRTACRRLLARVATGDPRVFRRRARVETAAAGICWIIGKANDLFTLYGGGMYAKDLGPYFGIGQSAASQRASTLKNAAGVQPEYDYRSYSWSDRSALGTTDLLVARRRQKIIELRDRYADSAYPAS